MTKTDAEIRRQALRILFEQLGPAEAGRFLARTHRERFDDTAWRAAQWEDASVAALAARARRHRAGKEAP